MVDTLPPPDIFLDVFDNAPVRELRPGEVLIAAGAPADQVFNILSGMVMLSRTGRDGRRQVLSFLFRDNFLGLTTTDRYYFTVEAVTSARVACCSRATFNRRLDSDPQAERAFLNMTYRVLEDLLDAVYSLGQRTAVELLQDVTVLNLGNFALQVQPVTTQQDPNAAATAPTQAETRPDIITLMVSPEDSIALNYFVYGGAVFSMTLRNPNDNSRVDAQSATLTSILTQYNISLPSKLPYAQNTRVDFLIPPLLPNDIVNTQPQQ